MTNKTVENKENAVILGIETCTNICSVALWDGKQMHEIVEEAARSHSKKLIPMIESVLEKAALTITDVDYVACARGPGSFTGVRIGVGVAKGLAYGQDIPIIPISPLAALAYRVFQQSSAQSVTTLLDARMGELYAANYIAENQVPVLVGKELLCSVEQLPKPIQLCAGTGAIEYRDELLSQGAGLSEVVYPKASYVVALAKRFQGQMVSAADFVPIYLRDKVTD